MEFYCGRTGSKKPSFPFIGSFHVLFFNIGLGHVSEIMTTGSAFRGAIISNNTTTNNNDDDDDRGLPFLF